MPVAAPPILTCPQWGARPPKQPPRLAGRPVRIIEHHTAGHAPVINGVPASDKLQAIRYAKVLQALHMDSNGWNDSGHNFLVMRTGLIVQGRWGTVTALQHGRMVESAHCPGQNDQPGIEHEQVDPEQFTAAQWEATVWLQAWIASRCGIRPTELYGHGHFYPTACPGVLGSRIGELRAAVAARLNADGREPARSPELWAALKVRMVERY